MDYKYIGQLLDRYWQCETSLEEEEILRAFFSQKDVPVELLKYRALFVYAQNEVKDDVLGADFDAKLLTMIDEPAPVKARRITMTQRLIPLFKAAAVVAIILTLSNAMQLSFYSPVARSISSTDATEHIRQGASVAIGDSTKIDTMQQSSIVPAEAQLPMLIK